MEKLLRHKKTMLITAVISAALGAAAIAGIIFFILRLWYFPMALCIAITAHGFYGCPFYFIAYANDKKIEIIISRIEGGVRDIEAIASAAGIKTEFAKRLLGVSASRGYVSKTVANEINF